MKAPFICIFLLFIPLSGFSATINVPVDYGTIQDAINASNNGDTVLVAPGTYVETIDFIGKAITVTSSDGAEVTVIDGNGVESVVKFVNGEGLDSVLDGFTVTGGTTGISGQGGGIIIGGSSPLIQNNIIRNNSTGYRGAGIFLEVSSCIIRNNTICQNQAGGLGGGLYARSDHAVIQENTFYGNSADYGGACYFSISSECDFVKNTVTNNTARRGGGIHCLWDDNQVMIRENEIAFNYANEGGGMACSNHAKTIITSNYFHHNIAEISGGAISCASADVMIENNILAWNSALRGGGIALLSIPPKSIVNNTLYGNMASEFGGGLFCLSSGAHHIVMNTIFWNNDAPEGPEISVGFNSSPVTLSISYCDVKGGQDSVYVHPGSTLIWGGGMIDDHPLFVQPVLDDFHVSYESPCRDTGLNEANFLPVTDFEGDPRITFGTVDIGADEFHTHLYYKGDATPGGSIKLVFVGVPYTDPVILVVGSGVIDPPMPTMYGDLYLELPLVLFDTKATLQYQGVYSLTIDLPLTVPAPFDVPMQALIGSELTNLSVLKVK